MLGRRKLFSSKWLKTPKERMDLDRKFRIVSVFIYQTNNCWNKPNNKRLNREVAIMDLLKFTFIRCSMMKELLFFMKIKHSRYLMKNFNSSLRT